MPVTISHRGDMIEVAGNLPAVGSKAPDFSLVANDLSEITLASYAGKNLILNIFPSIDTPTCAKSTRRFNEELSALDNTHVLCVSADLPFAQARFCGASALSNRPDTQSPNFRNGYIYSRRQAYSYQ